MKRAWELTVLRIGADGYLPFLTRPIRRSEGELTLDVSLTPDPGIVGKVLTPSGAPARGAVLAVCTWTNEVGVERGTLRYSGHGQRLGRLGTTADDGTFRLRGEVDPWLLVVAHDSGYAEVLPNDGGRIVNISSGLARFTIPGSSAYASMKGAVEVLTRYLAKELGSRGISVNTVAPRAIATDFSGGMVRDNPEVNQRVADMTALGRAGQPDDIGPMIATLLSEDNRWINGQRIEVSGGMALLRDFDFPHPARTAGWGKPKSRGGCESAF
jgi:NAD(P)-dependent dehydrogenase (short-subunit alcohol dehydrogenase family)